MKKVLMIFTKSTLVILLASSLSSCQKENDLSSDEVVKEKKIIFYLDNEEVNENDERLLAESPFIHVDLGVDNETEYNYSFSNTENYVSFLENRGYSEKEIKTFTGSESESSEIITKSSTVDPSLMTVWSYYDLNRSNFLATFTGNQTLCGQVWENQILGMRVDAASSACQTGAMPATIQLFDNCNYSGAVMNISLVKCQSGKNYQYAIAPKHFRNWYNKSPKQIVSSWKFI